MDESGRPLGQGAEVAVIGMAGRFPGSPTIEAYWRNLVNGVEGIQREAAADASSNGRAPASGGDHDHEVRASSRIDDIDLFDADFFGFSPKEAELMDPQHRLFLEAAHDALERAGYDPERYAGLIGVYAGMGANSYFRHALESLDSRDGALGLQLVIGNDKDYLTTMVSYKLNLRGPSVAVQTACSTSLVSVHLACQALLDYECDLALAGGVSVRAPQPASYRYYEGGILSPDGYCRAFDARAQGTVFGNGLGLVVLRRLEDALTDGDQILAVIRGSAVNNDGSGKVGYTAPAVRGQRELILTALARAGVDPASIQYVEAHGTGTPLGDPIEITALTEAYRAKTDATGYCGIGSVKTNIGHLDAAAGVAGLIKTVLALSNRTMPPSLHFHEPNPRAPLAHSPFFVVTDARRWDGPGPRRAAVNSLGIGGTNAHVVLEEAPAQTPRSRGRAEQLLVLSARSAEALDAATAQLAVHLAAHPDLDLAEVACTLQTGRRLFPHRRAVVCASAEEAVTTLEAACRGGDGDADDASRGSGAAADNTARRARARVSTDIHDGAKPSVAFMFPGGGAQHAGMAAGLYRTVPTFRRHVDECLACLRPLLGCDLAALMFPAADQQEAAAAQLRQTTFGLPALFTIEYALARLWMAWGVRPQAMLGHSLGEYVAACLAGVLPLADALSLVVHRSRLLDDIVPGSMISVPLSEAALRPLLGDDLALAAINAPTLCVVSGSNAAIDALGRRLAESGVEARPLRIAVGAHSPLVEPILETFRQFVSRLTLNPPRIPFVSNVTGTWITPEQATSADYWAQHLRHTVRFAEGVGRLLEESSAVLLEVGPGRTLSTVARAHADSRGRRVLSSLPHPYDPDPDVAALFHALGELWLAGADVDWHAHHAPDRPRRVLLPTYPFERQRYWVGSDDAQSSATSAHSARTGRAPLDKWLYVPVWKQSVPASTLPPRAAASSPGAGAWMIVEDDEGVGERVGDGLTARGERVVRVRRGSAFASLGDRRFTIDPRDPADYERLFRALDPADAPQTIVHLSNVTRDALTRRPACPEPEDTSPFDELLFLGQAALARAAGPLHLAVCGTGLAQVTPGDEICPGKMRLVGACRVLPQEHVGVTTRWIDLRLPKAAARRDRLADLLIHELLCESPVQAIAYRGRQRWVQTFDPISPRADERMKRGGVYVITGGMGGLGLILARHLATAHQARLVLAGRTALPARAAWSAWQAEHPAEDAISSAIRAIEEIEAAGGEAITIAADVCEPADVDRLFRDASRRFGRIDGVFHLAGVPGGGLMQLKTASMAAAVFAPKVRGTIVLLEACRGRRLDFVALFSSITGVTGGIGQSDHCAASACMDALAQSYAGRGDLRVVAIDWDAWQSARQQDAALAQLPEIKRQSERWRAEFGIRPAEGMEMLARALSANLPRVIVSTRDVALAMAAHDRALATVTAQPAVRERATTRRETRRQQPYVAPVSETEIRVASAWQHVLGATEIGLHDSLFELGAHSLLILQVVARLRTEFSVDVPVRAVFEQPTIAQLSAFIDDRRAAAAAAARAASSAQDDDDGELARLLEEVERLTPDQVRSQLDELGPQAASGDRP